MPQHLGRLIGLPEFEQARGVLMELCVCTADEALVVVGDIANGLGVSLERGVSMLRAAPTRPALLEVVRGFCH
jgi:hypothetical protein